MTISIDEAGACLQRAANIIRERGHCKKKIELWPDGPVCLLGAIKYASGMPANQWAWSRGADAAINKMTSYMGFDDPYLLSRWNDEKVRTADEVISALEKAGLS